MGFWNRLFSPKNVFRLPGCVAGRLQPRALFRQSRRPFFQSQALVFQSQALFPALLRLTVLKGLKIKPFSHFPVDFQHNLNPC